RSRRVHGQLERTAGICQRYPACEHPIYEEVPFHPRIQSHDCARISRGGVDSYAYVGILMCAHTDRLHTEPRNTPKVTIKRPSKARNPAHRHPPTEGWKTSRRGWIRCQG